MVPSLWELEQVIKKRGIAQVIQLNHGFNRQSSLSKVEQWVITNMKSRYWWCRSKGAAEQTCTLLTCSKTDVLCRGSKQGIMQQEVYLQCQLEQDRNVRTSMKPFVHVILIENSKKKIALSNKDSCYTVKRNSNESNWNRRNGSWLVIDGSSQSGICVLPSSMK